MMVLNWEKLILVLFLRCSDALCVSTLGKIHLTIFTGANETHWRLPLGLAVIGFRKSQRLGDKQAEVQL